jgi:hypothetical protein
VDHALNRPVSPRPIEGGAGVLMLPVPSSGVVRRVEGISAARKVPGVEDVEIDVSTGQIISAWPEGGNYPGFVFSRGSNALEAERSLRLANACLKIVVAPVIAQTVGAGSARAA